MIKTLIRGSLLGLCALAVNAGLLGVLSPGEFREAVSRPLFLLSGPALFVGERAFGQAPIPLFAVLACYWATLGAILAGLGALTRRSVGRAQAATSEPKEVEPW